MRPIFIGEWCGGMQLHMCQFFYLTHMKLLIFF